MDNRDLDSKIEDDSIPKENEICYSIEHISRSVEQISIIITELSLGIKKATDINSIILSEANQARERMKQTDSILASISRIASQTKLLGINATIEAAHAGQAGRTFSVVAEEIGKVSISTNEAINKINSAMENMRSSFDAISNKSIEANIASIAQEEVLNEILVSVKELSAMTKLLKKSE